MTPQKEKLVSNWCQNRKITISKEIRYCKPLILKGLKKNNKNISTQGLIMEVDFCPVLCIAEMPILRAFVAFSHFVWYRRISSNELQMV